MFRARHVFLLAFLALLLVVPAGSAQEAPQVKLSVFNYGAMNMEASGYGTSVTNMLIGTLRGSPSLSVLDRKELEAFLSLNDLQQNDDVGNVVQIGSKLALDFIVAGTVGKSGQLITINTKLISIGQKRTILYLQSKAFGDADLASETRKISDGIVKAVLSDAERRRDGGGGSAGIPVNVEARPGNMSIFLRWEDPAGYVAAGYKIDRGLSREGPFTRLAQVQTPEYLDQGLEKKKVYYYRVRAFDAGGIQSGYSLVVSAETAPTPLAPIILKAEGHVKSILLTWSANPGKSEDPSPLKGFRIYRARVEKGPYKEAVNLLIKDAASSADAAAGEKITHADRGLADGTDYYYRITAYNENNLESNFSEPIKGTTTPGLGKVAIQGEMIREIRLNWAALESPYVKGYYVYRSTEEGKGFTRLQKVESFRAGQEIQYTDLEGLGDKTRYYYQVTAFEEPDLETNPSPTVSAVTRGKPPVPKDLKAESGLVRKVHLTWTANQEEDVEGYKLYRSKVKEGNYEFIKKISGRTSGSAADEGGLFGFGTKIEDGTTYYYVLTSYNKVNVESDVSTVASATTKARPRSPTRLSGEIQAAKVFLTWAPNPEPDIVSYTVYESTATGRRKIETVKGDTRFSEAAPEPGKSRTYVVTARDRDDLESDPSEGVTLGGK
jgi:fibronectin type 3 domain-containing protein/TolB-like protein